MKIATYNINNIRRRLPRLLEWPGRSFVEFNRCVSSINDANRSTFCRHV